MAIINDHYTSVYVVIDYIETGPAILIKLRVQVAVCFELRNEQVIVTALGWNAASDCKDLPIAQQLHTVELPNTTTC